MDGRGVIDATHNAQMGAGGCNGAVGSTDMAGKGSIDATHNVQMGDS